MSNALRFAPRVAAEVLYPKGSIVVCRACGLPIYRLQASLHVGEPVGKSAWKYAPVSVADILALRQRADLDVGVRAALLAKTVQDWQTHCEAIAGPKAGDYADCPLCRAPFCYVETREDAGASSFSDRGYTIQLATIPPTGKARPILTRHA